jgi:hypothetical protein
MSDSKQDAKFKQHQEEEESEDEEEESFDNDLNTLHIKKEYHDTVTISKSLYEKLLLFIDRSIHTNQKLKQIVNKKTITQDTQTDEVNIVDYNVNIHNFSQNESTTTITIDKSKQEEYEKTIESLKNEIIQLKNDYENKLQEKEKFSAEAKKEIEKLLTELVQLRTNNKLLKKELNQLKLSVELTMNKNKTFDKLEHKPLLLNKITKYLKPEEKINLAKSSRKLWVELFYQTKSEVIKTQLLKKESIIHLLTKTSTAEKFDVSHEDVNVLISDYMTNNRISGIEIRNDIVRSIVFLEKFVKNPLKHMQGYEQEKQQGKKPGFLNFRPGGKREQLFNKLSNVVTIISGVDDIQPDPYTINYEMDNPSPYNGVKVIQFEPEEFKNLFLADQHIINTFNTDKSINVDFQYKKSEDIKLLLSDFFKSQLPKTTYQTFLSKICEMFSDLLFSCYLALRDIKHLEIVKHALYCRFMKYRERTAEMEFEIKDMNHFAQSTKEVKEMLLKQKNEVEMKYNSSLMTINKLTAEKEKHDQRVSELNDKIKKNDEKFEMFKSQLLKEYKNIQNDFNLTKKERDLLKTALIDFKNYLLQNIGDDGELIEMKKEST